MRNILVALFALFFVTQAFAAATVIQSSATSAGGINIIGGSTTGFSVIAGGYDVGSSNVLSPAQVATVVAAHPGAVSYYINCPTACSNGTGAVGAVYCPINDPAACVVGLGAIMHFSAQADNSTSSLGVTGVGFGNSTWTLPQWLANNGSNSVATLPNMVVDIGESCVYTYLNGTFPTSVSGCVPDCCGVCPNGGAIDGSYLQTIGGQQFTVGYYCAYTLSISTANNPFPQCSNLGTSTDVAYYISGAFRCPIGQNDAYVASTGSSVEPSTGSTPAQLLATAAAASAGQQATPSTALAPLNAALTAAAALDASGATSSVGDNSALELARAMPGVVITPIAATSLTTADIAAGPTVTAMLGTGSSDLTSTTAGSPGAACAAVMAMTNPACTTTCPNGSTILIGSGMVCPTSTSGAVSTSLCSSNCAQASACASQSTAGSDTTACVASNTQATVGSGTASGTGTAAGNGTGASSTSTTNSGTGTGTTTAGTGTAGTSNNSGSGCSGANVDDCSVGAALVAPPFNAPTGTTASDAYSSIQQLIPGMSGFTLPTMSATCPTYTFNFFGQSMVMDSQCVLAAQYATQIYNVFMLMWVILAFRVFFSA